MATNRNTYMQTVESDQPPKDKSWVTIQTTIPLAAFIVMAAFFGSIKADVGHTRSLVEELRKALEAQKTGLENQSLRFERALDRVLDRVEGLSDRTTRIEAALELQGRAKDGSLRRDVK